MINYKTNENDAKRTHPAKKNPDKKKTKMSRKKKIAIISTTSVLGLVAIVLISGFLYFNSQLNKINFKPSSTNSGENQVVKGNDGSDLMANRNVLNVLLIGSDTRVTSEDGRSDSMILISINKQSKKIIMTSFMRDMYVDIEGHGKAKINAAYSYGGASLLIKTIEQNFDIKIDQYVSVDFFSFIKIIDQLGGVNITVTPAELKVMNDYIHEINKLEHLSADDGYLQNSGTNLLLTGKQALGYSRIRYVGNADFQRTERQRTVLNQVFIKLKKQNILQQMSIMNTLLPDVTTDFSKGDLMSLATNSLTYKNYDTVQNRIPIEGSYNDAKVNGQDVLEVDLAKNISNLKSTIYGQ